MKEKIKWQAAGTIARKRRVRIGNEAENLKVNKIITAPKGAKK